jgi:hypothetical protein
MTTYEKVSAAGFEVQTCGRCGGSGRYSFNQVDGDRCYGCHGSGIKYTKRGATARNFMIALQTRPVAELKAGYFFADGAAGKFRSVLSIKESGSCAIVGDVKTYYIDIETKACTYGVFPSSNVRFVRDEADRLETVAAALAYQDTLTAMGKPKKK